MPPTVLNKAREQLEVYLIHQVVFFNDPVCNWFQLVRVTKEEILGTIFPLTNNEEIDCRSRISSVQPSRWTRPSAVPLERAPYIV